MRALKRDLTVLLSDYRFFVKDKKYEYEHENRVLVKIPSGTFNPGALAKEIFNIHGLYEDEDYLYKKIPKNINQITVHLSPDCHCSVQEVKTMIVNCGYDVENIHITESIHPRSC